MSKQSKARPRTSPARVRELLAQNQHGSALNDAIWLQENEPSPESALCYQETLIEAALRYAHYEDSIAFHKVLGRATQVKTSAVPNWNDRVAILHAIAGDRTKAIAMLGESPDPATLAKIDGHIADITVVRDRTDLIPPGHEAGHKAIVIAFDFYSAGQDEQAREALNAVGLQSPYLDWKLLVRGLMAWSTGDDARAIENFQRLAKDRKCIRLCTGIRSQIDKPWAESLPQGTLKLLSIQHGRLTTNPVLRSLNAIREVTHDKITSQVWKMVAKELPTIKQQSIGLLPKLQDVFYNLVLRRGQPEDVKPLLNHFGPPWFDPELIALQARAWEAAMAFEDSRRFWLRYNQWLEKAKLPLPASVVTHMRAVIFNTLGDQIVAGEESPDGLSGLERILESAFGPPGKQKEKSKKDFYQYYQKCIALAPNWFKPVEKLSVLAIAHDDVTMSLKVVEDFLERNPNHFEALARLTRQMEELKGYDLALPRYEQMVALKPYDEVTQLKLIQCAFTCLFYQIRDKRFYEYDTLILKYEEKLTALRQREFLCVRILNARKRNKPQDADELEAKLNADGVFKLANAFFLALTATQLKLKPADTKRYRSRFEELLLTRPVFEEVPVMLALLKGSIDSTGKSVVAKKLYDKIPMWVLEFIKEDQCEQIAVLLLGLEAWAPLKKLIKTWERMFPQNPYILIALGELTNQKKTQRAPYQAKFFFARALELIRSGKYPQHAHLEGDLVNRINELEEEIQSPFDDFFGYS